MSRMLRKSAATNSPSCRQTGDLLVAEATERHRSKTLGRYDVTVRRDGVDVAHFRGTVFFKDTLWQPEAHS